MIWNTWRQHRLYNLFMSQHCLGVVSAKCDRLRGEQHGDDGWVADLLPWLVAVFAGAPLAVRDFETGSYRFSATQGSACCLPSRCSTSASA